VIEVELKCELFPAAQRKLREKLQFMTFHGVVQSLDKYYDTIKFDLLQQAVFVRVRNNSQLQFKYNESHDVAHVQSLERVFPLPPETAQQVEEMNALFTRFIPPWHAESDFEVARVSNGLVELAHIGNRREVYMSDDMQISIDQVEDLGDFLEVELQCEEESDTSKALAELHSFISGLGVQPIEIGYVEMWLRVHNPQAYQLGKYRL
jgi:adenylate cyclase, class 2